MAVLVDAVFWIDMVLHFRCGYVDKRMTIHMKSADIAKRYLQRYLWIDLIANFPYYNIAASKKSLSGHCAVNSLHQVWPTPLGLRDTLQ